MWPKGKITGFIIITGAVALCAAAFAFYYYNPSQESWMPKCLFRMLTGWDCPGCGSSRALHSLLHLRIWEALAYNPLLVAGIPYVILLAWSQYLGGREKFPRMHNAITSRAAIIVIIAIIVFYTVIRNVLWN